jgi:hypothetical protein
MGFLRKSFYPVIFWKNHEKNVIMSQKYDIFLDEPRANSLVNDDVFRKIQLENISVNFLNKEVSSVSRMMVVVVKMSMGHRMLEAGWIFFLLPWACGALIFCFLMVLNVSP